MKSIPPLRSTFAIAAIATGTLVAEPVIDSINSNGVLTFSDPGATGNNGYVVEWSNDLANWRKDWSELSFIETMDGEATSREVPLFYRVAKVASESTPLPAPVSDSDYHNKGAIDRDKSDLGKLLFWDKILSGNMNISCATCHHTMAGTSDGLSLPIGEGGEGLGVMRLAPSGIDERVPRNAPHVWNLGALEFDTMFHDGRLKTNPSHPSGFDNPAGNNLPAGLDNPLAAQAMFPVTSATEMAGGAENPIGALSAANDLPGLWEALAQRLRGIPEYVDLFTAVYNDVGSAADITYAHAANAIAEFEIEMGRADNSPFDAYLRGDQGALSGAQRRGMALFYGKANCADCHSGKFQTDQGFHAIAMPQIGPGKGDGATGHGDDGLARETNDPADLYKFRTPSLRNVALTGPWGHAGAYDSLEAVVRHHLDPATAFANYDRAQAKLPANTALDAVDFTVMDDPTESDAIVAANEITPVNLSDEEVDELLAFLHALTDPSSVDTRRFVPMRVPSGLPVAD